MDGGGLDAPNTVPAGDVGMVGGSGELTGGAEGGVDGDVGGDGGASSVGGGDGTFADP